MGSKPNWARGGGALGNVLLQYAFMKDRQSFTEKERVRREEAMAKLREESNAAIDARQQAAFAERERLADLDRERNLFAPEGAMIPNLTGGEAMPNPYAGMTRSEVADDLRLKDMMNPQPAEMSPYQAGSLELAREREARIAAAEMSQSDPSYSYTLPGGQEIDLSGGQMMTQHRFDNPQNTADRALDRQVAMYDTKQADKYFADRLDQYNEDLFPLLGGKSGTKYYGGAYEKQPEGGYKRTTEVGGFGPDVFYKDKVDTKTLAGVLAEGLSEKLNDGIDKVEWNVFKEIAKSRGANLKDILSEWSTSHGEYVKQISGKWYVNVDGEWMAHE